MTRKNKDLEDILAFIEHEQIDIIQKFEGIQKAYRDVIAISRDLRFEEIRGAASLNLRNLGISKQALLRLQALGTPNDEKVARKKKFFKKKTKDDDDEILGLSLFDEME